MPARLLFLTAKPYIIFGLLNVSFVGFERNALSA